MYIMLYARLEWYLPCRFALAVAFALKQRNGFPPLSATVWQLTRDEYALSPAALRMRGKSRISRLNSFASEPFQSVIVNAMPRQSFDAQALCYESIWLEVCFYAVVGLTEEYLHENTDRNDSWIPAWTTDRIPMGRLLLLLHRVCTGVFRSHDSLGWQSGEKLSSLAPLYLTFLMHTP